MRNDLDLEDRPHTLYRFFNEAGELLYIGITWNPMIRWYAHEDHKDWWLEARTSTLDHYPNRKAVLDAERDAIKAEKPKYNILHTVKPRKTSTGVIKLPVDFQQATTSRFHLDGADYALQLRWGVRDGTLVIRGLRVASCDLPSNDHFPAITGLGDDGPALTGKVMRTGALGSEERRARRRIMDQLKADRREA